MIEELKKLKAGKIKEEVPLKNITSYRLSGMAKCTIHPESVEDLIKILKHVRKNGIKYTILGNGSNVVFVGDFDGVVIKMDAFESFSQNDIIVKVGSGYNLMKLAYKTARDGFSGLEFASGIPGSVGGAVYMNAGAYDSDMGYVVSEVLVLTPDYQVKTMYNKEIDFHYRTSFFQMNKDYVVLEATLVLKNGNKEKMLDLIEERKKRRWMTQPLEFPSAGSVFRNPPGDSAWRLIDYLGYKGKSHGNAEVSEKHANFIINRHGASGIEIKELIEKIREDVKKEFNIELKVEQEFIE